MFLAFLTYFLWCELEPILAIELKQTYMMNQEKIGYFFIIMVLGSLSTSITLQFFPPSPKKVKRILILACLGCGLGFLLNGPVEYLP